MFQSLLHRLIREATVAAAVLLPSERRIAVERRARGREEAYRLRRADYVVVSYGKSGRTWLRVMLSRFYQLRYGLPERTLLSFDNLHRKNAAVPVLHITHDNYLRDYTGSGTARTDYLGRPVVLLVRHPADTAVSQYFQWRYRMAKRKKLLNGYPQHGLDISLADFVLRHPAGMKKTMQFLNEWAAALPQLDRVLMVRYEDMRAAPSAELRRVLAFMGSAPTDLEIGQVVAYASFENMRDLEKRRTFRASGSTMAAADKDNPDSYKVRRAKVGGYRDYFDDDQVAQIEGCIRDRLDRVFGYGDVAAGRRNQA